MPAMRPLPTFLRALAAPLLALACAGCASIVPPRGDGGLPPAVKAALAEAGLPEDAIGVAVLRLDSRQPLVSHRSGVPMQPASTIKLVTSAVALDRLGPNTRGFTELRSAAPVVGEVLQGDLVLRGGADPELGLPQLWALLAELRWQGVREIAGDVLLDRHLFNPPRSDLGLPPFDEAPEFPYNVIPDALQLAGNLVTLELAADGERVMARLLPPLPGVELVNTMRVADAPCNGWAGPGLWMPPETSRQGAVLRIELRGAFPKHCRQRPELQLMDRTDLADRLLRHAWQQLGGTWRGQAREAEASSVGVTRLLARRESRPWGEVLRVINKRSDNPLTRMMFLGLGLKGAAAEPATPTAELAAREVQAWFREHDIPTDGLVMDNGSGLSRRERITPLQLALVVQAALNGRFAPELLMSLPQAGVDGAFVARFRDSAANGRARLKPGGLRDVGSLAGVVPDADGRPMVMVFIANHPRPVIRKSVDALIEWIATSRFGPR